MSDKEIPVVEESRVPFVEPLWANQATIPSFSTLPGIEMRTIAGANLMLNFVRIQAGSSVPAHSHPHEQGGTVLEGVIELTLGEETRALRPGDAYIVPGGVVHSATSVEGCLVLDVFSPPRADYLNR